MLRPPPRSTLTDTLLPYTTLFRSFIIFVGRMAFAVLVPSHGGDREVTVQQIFRLDIAAPYPLGLIACAAIIGLSPGKTGIEEQVMPHFLLNADADRSEEHTSELQSLMRISYAVFCLKKKKDNTQTQSSANIIMTCNTSTYMEISS